MSTPPVVVVPVLDPPLVSVSLVVSVVGAVVPVADSLIDPPSESLSLSLLLLLLLLLLLPVGAVVDSVVVAVSEPPELAPSSLLQPPSPKLTAPTTTHITDDLNIL